ncbi:MAG: endonuclease/exonuclease/phosphatase family protein [Candidatus Omnitrophica bacterium]|nr:endonuclease/exonuclease/phosphatase family protein [Candidatus Omnitrophota bacterium]
MKLENLYISLICIFALSGCSVKNYLFNYSQPNRPRFAQLNTFTPPSEIKDTIKVVSYNIKFSRKIELAIQLLTTDPDLKNADILLLQEMDETGAQTIALALKCNYVYYPAVIYPRKGKDFGNAILSKWEMSDDEKIILPNFSINQRERIAVGATIQIQDKKIRVYCVHLGVFVKPTDRKMRISRVVDRIPADIKYAVIGGDFNSFTKKDRKEINEAFTKNNFDNSTSGIGWTHALGKKIQLDHIYTKGFTVVSKGKVINRKPSDHLPVWIEIK